MLFGNMQTIMTNKPKFKKLGESFRVDGILVRKVAFYHRGVQTYSTQWRAKLLGRFYFFGSKETAVTMIPEMIAWANKWAKIQGFASHKEELAATKAMREASRKAKFFVCNQCLEKFPRGQKRYSGGDKDVPVCRKCFNVETT